MVKHDFDDPISDGKAKTDDCGMMNPVVHGTLKVWIFYNIKETVLNFTLKIIDSTVTQKRLWDYIYDDE